MCASSANDEFVWHATPTHGVGSNRYGRKLKERGLDIFRRRKAMQVRFQPAYVELLAAAALGGGCSEKWMGQQGVKQALDGLAAGRPSAAGIVGLPGVSPRPGVKQHVPRAGIEAGGDVARLQISDVRYATEVENDAVFIRRTEYSLMKSGNERSALPAGSHVPTAKISNNTDLAEFRQQRRVA